MPGEDENDGGKDLGSMPSHQLLTPRVGSALSQPSLLNFLCSQGRILVATGFPTSESASASLPLLCFFLGIEVPLATLSHNCCRAISIIILPLESVVSTSVLGVNPGDPRPEQRDPQDGPGSELHVSVSKGHTVLLCPLI